MIPHQRLGYRNLMFCFYSLGQGYITGLDSLWFGIPDSGFSVLGFEVGGFLLLPSPHSSNP